MNHMTAIRSKDKKYFYKYRDIMSALDILENLHVKCTSPYLFNDPFDTVKNLPLDFKTENISELLNNNAADEKSLKKTLNKLYKLKNDLLESARIFCMSDRNDSIEMWSDYSNKHRGVVIEFSCSPDSDSVFNQSYPVKYSDNIPFLIKFKDLLKSVTGETKISINSLSAKMILHKSSNYSYEKEWRFAIKGKNKLLHEYYRIEMNDISAIYLGCRIAKEDKDLIMNLIQESLPHVFVYQAREEENKFALTFDNLF